MSNPENTKHAPAFIVNSRLDVISASNESLEGRPFAARDCYSTAEHVHVIYCRWER